MMNDEEGTLSPAQAEALTQLKRYNLTDCTNVVATMLYIQWS